MTGELRTAEHVLAGYKLLEPFDRPWVCGDCSPHDRHGHPAGFGRVCEGIAAPQPYSPPTATTDAGPRLVVVEWEDSTNVQEWTPIAELGEWAADGGWRVRNVGYLVYEDDECVVLAGRLAWHVEPPQAGLYERIPKRAIISGSEEGWGGRQAEQGHESRPATQGEPTRWCSVCQRILLPGEERRCAEHS